MKKGITLAGNIIVDHNREVEKYPEHSNLVVINKSYITLGGAVSNSGISLSRIDPTLAINVLGVIGDDDDGKNALNEFRKYSNIDCSQVYTGKQNTGFTDVIVDTTNHTRTFFSFGGANSELSPEHFDFNKMDSAILHVGYILLLDTLDSPDAEFGTKMARVLFSAQQAGIKTSIDIVTEDSDRYKDIVPHALKYTDYCIINEEEAARTVGIKVRGLDGVLDVKACRSVCEELFILGVGEWVVIHSREGGIGLNKKGEFTTKPSLKLNPKEIKGTTGAGDAFLSGVLYGAYKGYSLDDAISLGIASSNASILEEGPTAGIKAENDLWEFYKSSEKENWPGFE